MNLLLLGVQGSGKGTQARLLCKKFNFFYVPLGDILRKVAKKDPIVAEFTRKGDLLPEDKTFEIVKNYLKENNVNDNLLFDGYPRTLEQLKWFEKDGTHIDLVFILEMSDEEAVKRLLARRMDSK